MNREIKFRAWDTTEKKMHHEISLMFANDLNGVFEGLNECGCIVMQYTGLKDKNGKEIYEGDILHKDSHWGWYVAFEDGAFCRIPINIIQRINWEHYRMEQKDVEDWEIIGNIHENPEFLVEGNQ